MPDSHFFLSTGIPDLDTVLQHLLPGDNVVWQVDSIEEEYVPFVHRFCLNAAKQGKKIVYFRFADHQSLMPKDFEAEIHQLTPEAGFENFLSQILSVIEEKGAFASFVFDSLSDLTVDWYSDWQLGNFFLLICPYLLKSKIVAYFGLTRGRHATHAINDIHSTAQVVLDIFKHEQTGQIYIQPLKVFERSSPTMYMLHAWDDKDQVRPVMNSVTISQLRGRKPISKLQFLTAQDDVWRETLSEVEKVVEGNQNDTSCLENAKTLYQKLLRMMITRDPRFLKLAEKYLDLQELLTIGKRMIGTGLIGGKSVGLLLGQNILKKKDPNWHNRLEVHDSFFIGSDVFYTYLVRNNCWWMRWKLRNASDFENIAEMTRLKMLEGDFPQNIKDQFTEMLNYFGQYPIIVRSSSLLEDAYGNAFAGKYESVFCPNQGTPAERLENFCAAVRKIYASTLRVEALDYRKLRGLLDRDEQMAILVQRVSGSFYGDYFFPQLAGVGFSFNPFVWDPAIDPKAGVMRLVFGLGTRAVDRSDDDYTRLVSLNAPKKRPETNIGEVRKFSQRRVDLLDLKTNTLASKNFDQVIESLKNIPSFPIDKFSTRDDTVRGGYEEEDLNKVKPLVISFDDLLTMTPFVTEMREMLQTLQEAYDYPVDIEFATNFLEDGSFRIYLLQCRPLQVKGNIIHIELPSEIPKSNILIRTRGPIIGSNVASTIDRLIYVNPAGYSELTIRDKYTIARIIGRLTHLDETGPKKVIMLLGPGRWATSQPTLGIPVSFSEINTVSVVCEIAKMHEGLIPDVSLGTHFFSDLVEMDMLYMAVYPERDGYVLLEEKIMQMPNKLGNLLPNAQKWAKVIHVIDGGSELTIKLYANSIQQEALCYFDKKGSG